MSAKLIDSMTYPGSKSLTHAIEKRRRRILTNADQLFYFHCSMKAISEEVVGKEFSSGKAALRVQHFGLEAYSSSLQKLAGILLVFFTIEGSPDFQSVALIGLEGKAESVLFDHGLLQNPSAEIQDLTAFLKNGIQERFSALIE